MEGVEQRHPSISSLRFPSPKLDCSAEVKAPVSFSTKGVFQSSLLHFPYVSFIITPSCYDCTGEEV